MSHREAEDKEVERLWISLRRDLSRLGADLHTAEDVVQETWLIATNNPPVERGSIRGWLRVVGTRLLWQSTGRERARVRLELLASRERSSSTENDPSADAEVLAHLRRYVYELPEPYHTVVRLRFFEDREVEDIARLLAVPKWTVHSRIQRGIARLRTRMGAPAERRRSRGHFLVWLRGPRSRWAPRPVRAWYALGLGLAGLVLLAAWGWAPREYRSALVRPSEAIVSAGQQNALGPVAPSTSRIPAHPAEEANSSAGISASHFAGTVRKPDGEPQAEAVVHSAALDGSRPETTTTSREDGRYEIEVSGDLLWASHPAWRSSTRCYLPSVLDSQNLDLALGPRLASVEVLVLTCDGVPVPDADILIDCGKKEELVTSPRGTLEYSSGPPSARTDAEGRASVGFPEDQLVDLTVLAPGLPYWNEKAPPATSGNTLEIRLPRPLSLSGVCADEAGHPLFKARVRVLQHFGLFVRSAETDDEGRFVVEGLTPGDFVLRAEEEPPGTGSARREGVLSSGTSPTLPLQLRLSEADSIFGRVVQGHLPVEGARVLLSEPMAVPAEGRRSTSVTDSQGRFSFGGCRAIGHAANVFQPGSGQLCFAVTKLRPGCGEVPCILPTESGQRAPIEVEFSGATDFAPRLIEFNHTYFGRTGVVVADPPGSRRFHSPPQAEGDYAVVCWHPELGTWTHQVKHDPSAPRVHSLVPQRGTLRARVVLPEGVRHEDIELSVPNVVFNRFGKTSTGGTARRLFPWSEEHRAFVGVLPLGTHQLSFRGKGLAEVHTTIEVLPGTTEVTLAPHRGVEVTLVFQSVPPRRAGMGPLGILDLDFFSSTGVVSVSLSGTEHRLVEDGFEFTFRIPVSTVELLARTRPGSEARHIPVLREGRRVIEPGELDGTSIRPRLRVELEDLPGIKNIKATPR